MKVFLLGRIIENGFLKGGDGYERYTFNLFRYLKLNGVEIELPTTKWMHFCHNRYRSLSGLICFDLLGLPFIPRQSKKVDIYHATFPQQAISFPLIKNNNLIITIHHIDDKSDNSNSFSQTIFKKYFHRLLHTSIQYSTHIIAISQQTKNELVYNMNVPEEKISVIYSGVNKKFKPCSKKKHRLCKTIGYLGSLTKRKNVIYLIELLKLFKIKYPNFKIQLKIFGTGPEYANLLNISSKFDEVILGGFVPESELVDIYNSFDIFVFPSQHEGFGFPIIEAESCGIPVFLRNDAKISNELKNGCIVSNNIEEMASNIFEALTDDFLYKKLRTRALEHAKQFTWDKCAEKTKEVYRKVVESSQ